MRSPAGVRERRYAMSRILIIDDESHVRKYLRILLQKEGYLTEEAPDGEKGLMLQRKNPADLVITDLIMPEKEGIETIREMKRDFPNVKIIAISGGGRVHTADYLKIAQHIGANRVFPKPFEKNEILAAVRELIGSSN